MRREARRDARCWPRYICGDPHFLSFLLGKKKNNLHSNFCEIVSLTVDILLPRPVLSDSCFFVTLVSILFPVERHYDQPILSISCIIQCTVQRVTGRIKSAQTTAWNKCCTVPKPLWSGSSVCPLLFSASFIVLYLFFAVCVQKPHRIFSEENWKRVQLFLQRSTCFPVLLQKRIQLFVGNT